MVSAAFGTVTGLPDRRFALGFCRCSHSADSAQRQECRLARYLILEGTEQEDLFTSTHRRDNLTSTPESAIGSHHGPSSFAGCYRCRTWTGAVAASGASRDVLAVA